MWLLVAALVGALAATSLTTTMSFYIPSAGESFGVAAGIGGSLVSILLIPVMLGYQLPIVGLPIPLGGRTPVPNAFAIWLDILVWAAAAAALSRIVRTRSTARAA